MLVPGAPERRAECGVLERVHLDRLGDAERGLMRLTDPLEEIVTERVVGVAVEIRVPGTARRCAVQRRLALRHRVAHPQAGGRSGILSGNLSINQRYRSHFISFIATLNSVV